ncbi:helix-turn-helix domain-containing protein [Rubrivirga sp.]|uniref:helix-turn-helix domain-containing protein n=1 Tax=Rubrivirga sp. TaxID=1885344 RepID=UPI003C71B574
MQFELSWVQIVATLLAGGGIVASVTIGAVLLARQSGSRQANVAFGSLMQVGAALVLYVLLIYIQPSGENLGIVFAPLPFTFAVGPLLYAYVRARLGKPWPGLGHWVLPAAQAVLVVSIAVSPMSVKQVYMNRVFSAWWVTVQIALFVLGLATYLALCWRIVRKQADAEYEWARSRYRWLRLVIQAATLVLGSALAFSLIGPLVPDLHRHEVLGIRWMPLVESILYSAVIYVLAVGGYIQAAVRVEPADEAPERKERYNVGEDAAAVHLAALDRLVATERPYLDPDLTLGSLASQIGLTDKVLSYLLNESLGTTYPDYVNELRVGEAQRRLADPESEPFTVLAIGLDAGFASKSTFNRVFKERTGQTPSAYRDRCREQAARPIAARPIAS